MKWTDAIKKASKEIYGSSPKKSPAVKKHKRSELHECHESGSELSLKELNIMTDILKVIYSQRERMIKIGVKIGDYRLKISEQETLDLGRGIRKLGDMRAKSSVSMF